MLSPIADSAQKVATIEAVRRGRQHRSPGRAEVFRGAGLGTPETTCVQVSLAILLHQNKFSSDIVGSIPLMETFISGYSADDYRSCAESWECSVEKAKANSDRCLAQERLLFGMVVLAPAEELDDDKLDGNAQQLTSAAQTACQESIA